MSLDVFCQLCARRDVMGGMKPTGDDGGGWAHLACVMTTDKANLDLPTGVVVGVDEALRLNHFWVEKAAKEIGSEVVCEACLRPGAMLLRCEHEEEVKEEEKKEEQKEERVSPRKTRKRTPPKKAKKKMKKCTKFLHPLCAEICDRARVITFLKRSGDRISYKCGLHSYFGLDLCGVCNRGDKQDEMLECDGCKRGYHMSCCTPPLKEVPDGDWFCQQCSSKEEGKTDDSGDKAKSLDTKASS